MTSTSIQSSILGPTSLIRLHDYDSNHENAELASSLRRVRRSLSASAGTIVFGMEDGTVSIFGLIFGVTATTSRRHGRGRRSGLHDGRCLSRR
jgi:hypothetical protein